MTHKHFRSGFARWRAAATSILLWLKRFAVLATVAVLLSLIAVGPAAAEPAPDPPPGGGPESLTAVINNIRIWLVAVLATGATLFLTVGFMRLMWANGDPGEAEKGKTALRSAAIGYAGALLAPLLVSIVSGWVS